MACLAACATSAAALSFSSSLVAVDGSRGKQHSKQSRANSRQGQLRMVRARAEQLQDNGKDSEQQQLQPPLSSLVTSLGRAAVAAAAVASLALLPVPADDALAYIGGGPYGREVTRGQNLSGRDFSGLDLTGQDFKTSILRQANFKGARLVGASFFDADLTGADFTDADLTGADFSLASAIKANFTNAVLEGAFVTGNTSFQNSIITGADFTEVYFRADQKVYLCRVAEGVNPVTGNDTAESLLC